MNNILDSLENSQSNSNALYLLGFIKQQDKDIEEVMRLYQEADNFGYIRAITKLCSIYERQNSYEKVFEHYKDVTDIDINVSQKIGMCIESSGGDEILLTER